MCRRIRQDVVWLSSAIANTSVELEDVLQPILKRSVVSKDDKLNVTEKGLHLLKILESARDHESIAKEYLGHKAKVRKHSELVSTVELVDRANEIQQESRMFVTVGSLGTDGIIAVSDISQAMSECNLLQKSIQVSGLGIALNEEKVASSCRIFSWDGSKLHSSNSFDPLLPGTRILRILGSLDKWVEFDVNSLIKNLDAKSIQTSFYDEVAGWFDRTGSGLNELRHLIRVLFTWFLKEHDVIPSEIFEKYQAISIHDQLEHLFTKTLSTEVKDRSLPEHLHHLKRAFEDTPFLNGSMFNDDSTQLRSVLPDEDYNSTDEIHSGLFTILKRYEWTLTEHDQVNSDTALDPGLIGSVFERFIALAKNITPGPNKKQPDGTYYTPKDLVDEMVCDAISADLIQMVEDIDHSDVANLLHPLSLPLSKNSLLNQAETKRAIIKRLREINVLDPCTGSGEFIVSTMNTLRRAERRLLLCEYDDISRTRHAISKQLYAVDVNPMAIQVTRFRLYLAIIGAQLGSRGTQEYDPFPNLDTRIVAADSLATGIGSKLAISSLSGDLINERRNIRNEYTYAHNLNNKKSLRLRDESIRKEIGRKVVTHLPEVAKWLKDDYLGNEDTIALCGLPILFGKDSWDIVIGNPPYQASTPSEKEELASIGYVSAGSGDLYCSFVELGVGLITGPGVLTLVVPHSICFAQKKAKLREYCISNTAKITLRTYNNGPMPMFPPHPFIKGGNQGAQSRQRVTILTATKSVNTKGSAASVYSSCYIGIHKTDRTEILRKRPSCRQRPNDTWTFAGSPVLSTLLSVMYTGHNKSSVTLDSNRVSYPATAYYFLTCLPEETFKFRGRKFVIFPDDEYGWARICLFNSTIFHSYWLMVGDAFHVLPSLFYSCRIPPLWESDPGLLVEAETIGRLLCSREILSASQTQFRQGGKHFPNFDFHSGAPELIERADEVCILGYGLSDHKDELLRQTKSLRMFQTWDLI